jgi:c-di-GMP-binding flagellar brake protein YcgR
MYEDKRASPRFLFSEPVAYGTPDVMVNGSVARNISLSGISLRVQGFVPIGTVLELQLRLGKSIQVIWTKAEVVRVREVMAADCYEIGLRFVRNEACTKAISEYIHARQFESKKEKELKSYG